jgi:ABC-type polysaccharide/polyol phosphate transport system ATPase subunit
MGKKMCFTGKNNICLRCILLGVEKKEMGVELK